MSPPKIIAAVAAALLVVVVAWKILSGDESSPEAQIRAALDRTVEAAEKKDLGGMMEFVSEEFRSGEITHQDVKRILFAQLHQNSWRRVVLSDTSIELIDDDNAKLFTDALLASAAMKEQVEVRGSLYHFDLTLRREDGEWKIISALWARK